MDHSDRRMIHESGIRGFVGDTESMQGPRQFAE